MKINKILAAGVAATLAVTSLSAVAGAEVQTKTFDVYKTTASFWNHSVKMTADVNKNIAQKLRQATTGKILLTDLNKYVRTTLNYEGFLNYLGTNELDDRQTYYIKNPGAYDYGANLYVAGVSITATGYQHIGDTATVTKTFKFKNLGAWNPWNKSINADGTVPADRDKAWQLVVLDDKTPIYHDGEFASYFFTEITSLELNIELNGVTENEEEYNYWTWISNSGDDSKRYIDIGDIAVYATQNGAVDYTYGATANTNADTDNTKDLAEITSVQAKEQLLTAGVETAVDGSTIGLGVIVGSVVGATDVGKVLTSNQKAAIGIKKTYSTYPNAITSIQGGAAVTMTASAATTEDIVAEGKLYTTGSKYLNKITDSNGNVLWFLTNEAYDQTTMLADLKALTSPMSASAFATKYGFTLLADKVAAVPVYEEVDKEDYYSIVSASASDDTKDFSGTGALIYNVTTGKYEYSKNVYATAFTAMKLSDTVSTAHLLAYAFANGGWYESEQEYADIANDLPTWNLKYLPNGLTNSFSVGTAKTNGWIPKTTYDASAKIKNLIERTDAKLLSRTNEYYSAGQTYGDGKTAEENQKYDDNQSYTATFWDGTNPYGFAGLASQVADFFNKQDNGTITFTFAADAGVNSGKWSDGVPSTEVGLKGFSSEYLNDFALFFNYGNTSGTMLSALKLDKTAGTVTFDISDYLKDCGGLTKATLENIYYGLDNGIKYNATTNKYGLWVSKVELAYDDAGKAAVDATTDDDTSDDTAVVVADDDDDDAEVEDDDVAEDDDIFEDDDVIEDDDDDDDDVDADVIEDDDDDDTDVNNDVDYVDAGADDDANPGTGVGLAVIPAIVAAAAVVVSKKRK